VVLDAGLVSLGGAPTPTITPTPTPAPGGGGSLPVTGGALTGIIGAGVLLLGGGAGLTLLARRRRANATLGE
jgi:5'-nucleotidase